MLPDTFWSKVNKDGPMQPHMGTPCWVWTASTNGGYAKFLHGYGHRAAFADASGPIPAGIFVLHRCDIRSCVRPDHLFLGTHKDNMRDMVLKGRSATKLTEHHVATIWHMSRVGYSTIDIGRYLACSDGTVYDVLHGRSWAHMCVPHDPMAEAEWASSTVPKGRRVRLTVTCPRCRGHGGDSRGPCDRCGTLGTVERKAPTPNTQVPLLPRSKR